jgi:hypothetical protein
VLLRIGRSLGAEEKRRSKRWPEFGQCRYVIGLPGILAALSEGASSPGPVSLTTADGSDDSPAAAEPERQPSKAAGAARPSSATTSTEEIWYHGPTAGHAPATVIEGKLVNSGPRGYCVVWPATAGARTKVGELIGVRADKALFIGAIRWLECTGGAWRFGVELLTPAARVVQFGRASVPAEQALLLPIEPVLRAAPELVARPGSVKSGAVLDLQSEGTVTRYRVRDLLESTPSFARFGLVLAEHKPEPR